jgi:Domain of unknown function (DUF4276)
MHIEFLVEEPSAEAFLRGILPKLLTDGTTSSMIVFQGKADLLKKIEPRLKGYRPWIPEDYRILVLIDEDRQDCHELKGRLETAAINARFVTKTNAATGQFTVLNRIAIEELEAWFFGDPTALTEAFPGVSPNLGSKAAYRNPDAITGGTWEALQRVLQRAGYYTGGMPKIEVARAIAAHMEPTRNTSASFTCFVQGLATLSR